MKPVIRADDVNGWLCLGLGDWAYGATPLKAYRLWLGRLGYSNIPAWRAILDSMPPAELERLRGP